MGKSQGVHLSSFLAMTNPSSLSQPDEQKYVLSANEDVEMRDVEDEEEEEEEVLSELDPDEGVEHSSPIL